ncbi:cystinosin-like, partial [Gracilinanus agilis]|uniref:cystinosin-like n=1 Tax=Gracilinanus agilis TaxID=191870 RepID=UPI001CFEB5AC
MPSWSWRCGWLALVAVPLGLLGACDAAALGLSAPRVVKLERGSSDNVSFALGTPTDTATAVRLDLVYFSRNKTILEFPEEVLVPAGQKAASFPVTGQDVGQVTLRLHSNHSNETSALVHFLVTRSRTLEGLNQVIGWIYFVAWSVSFYPQVFENWRRKSVVGLSFDFIALNLTGFIAYAVFNVGLFWVPYVK